MLKYFFYDSKNISQSQNNKCQNKRRQKKYPPKKWQYCPINFVYIKDIFLQSKREIDEASLRQENDEQKVHRSPLVSLEKRLKLAK